MEEVDHEVLPPPGEVDLRRGAVAKEWGEVDCLEEHPESREERFGITGGPEDVWRVANCCGEGEGEEKLEGGPVRGVGEADWDLELR